MGNIAKSSQSAFFKYDMATKGLKGLEGKSPPKPPPALAPLDTRQADAAGESAMMDQRRRKGFESAFTGGKKTTLG